MHASLHTFLTLDIAALLLSTATLALLIVAWWLMNAQRAARRLAQECAELRVRVTTMQTDLASSQERGQILAARANELLSEVATLQSDLKEARGELLRQGADHEDEQSQCIDSHVKGLKVLVHLESEREASLLTFILEDADAHVSRCHSMGDVVSLLQQGEQRVAFIDGRVLLDDDAGDACPWRIAREQGLKVIATSNRELSSQRRTSLAERADHIMEYPLEPSRVVLVMRTLAGEKVDLEEVSRARRMERRKRKVA